MWFRVIVKYTKAIVQHTNSGVYKVLTIFCPWLPGFINYGKGSIYFDTVGNLGETDELD